MQSQHTAELGPKPSKRTHERKHKVKRISRDTETNKTAWKKSSKYCHLDFKMTALLSFNIILIIKITENRNIFS